MARTLQVSLPPMEVQSLCPRPSNPDKVIVPLTELLRLAIGESGWKQDAIAATLGVDGPYFSRMLSGEKPISLKHLTALPDGVQANFAKRYAEAFGWIVVQPVSGVDAVKQLVQGLLGVLGEKRDVA